MRTSYVGALLSASFLILPSIASATCASADAILVDHVDQAVDVAGRTTGKNRDKAIKATKKACTQSVRENAKCFNKALGRDRKIEDRVCDEQSDKKVRKSCRKDNKKFAKDSQVTNKERRQLEKLCDAEIDAAT